MKVSPKKTTQVTKPKAAKKPLAPQTPDTNRPDLGRPTTKVTTAKKAKGTPKK